MQTKLERLQKDNNIIRERISQCLEKFLHIAGWKAIWDLINELIENELQQEELTKEV